MAAGVRKEFVAGSGSSFAASSRYVPGTLAVRVNGVMLHPDDVTEVSPGSGTFAIAEAALDGDQVSVFYQTPGASAPAVFPGFRVSGAVGEIGPAA